MERRRRGVRRRNDNLLILHRVPAPTSVPDYQIRIETDSSPTESDSEYEDSYGETEEETQFETESGPNTPEIPIDSNLNVDEVDFVHRSQVRTSLASTHDQPKPESDAEHATENSFSENECCPICMEPWTTTGLHRIGSLSCGHLFGKKCIERWLRSTPRCPSCNRSAQSRSFRPIYLKNVRAVDTAERDRVMHDYMKEKARRKEVEGEVAMWCLSYQQAAAEVVRLKEQIKALQESAETYARTTSNATTRKCDLSSTPASLAGSSSASLSVHFHPFKPSHVVSTKGARLTTYNYSKGVLLVSRSSPSTLYPGFGVSKISSLDFKSSEFVPIHDQPIRDMCLNSVDSDSDLLLTVALSGVIKLTHTGTNNPVKVYTPDLRACCCVWSSLNSFQFYIGTSNRRMCLYDVRGRDSPVNIAIPAGEASPFVDLQAVPPSPGEDLGSGGVLAAGGNGLFFMDSSDLCQPLNIPGGLLTSLCFEPRTRHGLISMRPTRNSPQPRVRHLVCRFHGQGMLPSSFGELQPGVYDPRCVCSAEVMVECLGGPSSVHRSRSTMFVSPADARQLVVCANDESAESVMLWDGSNGSVLQQIRVPPGQPVLDTLFIAPNASRSWLALLSSEQLALYSYPHP